MQLVVLRPAIQRQIPHMIPHSSAAALAALGLSLSCWLACLSSAPDVPLIAPYFGTKTRYEEVNPQLLRDGLSVNRSVLRAPSSERCSPVHLTAVIRHGSRYPTVKNIRRIQRLSELVRREASRGSEPWQRNIQSRWENWFSEDMDGELLGLLQPPPPGFLELLAAQLHNGDLVCFMRRNELLRLKEPMTS